MLSVIEHVIKYGIYKKPDYTIRPFQTDALRFFYRCATDIADTLPIQYKNRSFFIHAKIAENEGH